MRGPISQQMSFGDGFIDSSLYELDEELRKVDELLCNPQLLKPFEEVFDESLGRPCTPVGIYLRMMYLKFRWGLSYEEVEREVREADSSPASIAIISTGCRDGGLTADQHGFFSP